MPEFSVWVFVGWALMPPALGGPHVYTSAVPFQSMCEKAQADWAAEYAARGIQADSMCVYAPFDLVPGSDG